MADDPALPRRRVTLEDVARRARVSTSAVSRTFTDGASVSKKTRSTVVKAANELGYRPNILARSLMTGRSALIALISDAFRNPYVMSIIDNFTIELQRRRLRPLVFNLSGDYHSADTIRLMSQYQVDGVIVASSTVDPQFSENVEQAGIPTVLAFGGSPIGTSVSAAFIDNFEGGRLAATAFLERGYSRIGFIGGAASTTTTRDRLRGFLSVLAEQGSEPIGVAYAGEYSHAAGMQAATQFLRDFPEADALFCADDLLGLGAMDAMKAAGRSYPDMGVIGFNDIPMASWPSHPLSTLRAPTDQVVVCAIDMLQAKIENHSKSNEKRIIGCQLVVRDTLRPLPAGV